MKARSLLAALLSLSALTLADQVTLKNGDRITGTVLKSDGKEIVVKTDYAGEIKLPWSQIQELTSESKLFVGAPDSKTVVGTVKTEDTDLVVNAQGGTVRVPKASVNVIRSESEQTAYESSLHPPFSRGWTGGLNLGFAVARGNAETKNLNLGFNAVRPTSHDKITMYANSLYSTNDKAGASPSVTAKTILGGIRYDRNITSRLFVFGAGDFQYDELQNLDLRSIFSAGLGLHVIKNDRTTLDLLGGGNYTRETYSQNPPTFLTSFTRDFVGATLGDEFTHKLGAASMLTQSFFFYPNLNNGNGYRSTFDLGLVTKINKWLGWQVNFNDRYVSNPVGANKKNDVLFTTGLNVAFTH